MLNSGGRLGRLGRMAAATLAGLLAVGATMLVGDGGGATATGRGAERYVALGDSYASGLGTREYDPPNGRCRRSPYSYPARVAEEASVPLVFVACAGATTRTVHRNQLPSLTRRTATVTITVGGNDAGFKRVLFECAKPELAGDCDAAIDRARRFIGSTLPGRLRRLYAAVAERSPRADVLVIGYPRLFNGEDCNAGTFFSPEEQTRLNHTANLLARVTAVRARRAGLGFVDPRRAFVGHAVCADREWLNGLSDPVSESYHPNRRGQRAYADLVGRRLRAARP